MNDREVAFLRWGLIPHWADDPAIGNRMINARSETVATKPSFRGPLRHRRCLILTDGFYEWKKDGTKKQPYHITMNDGEPFAFAGLWDTWEKQGEIIESCTILTTDANSMMKDLHERMPVILESEERNLWLDPTVQDPKVLTPLLRPFESARMAAFPVSTLVNNPRNDDPRCVESVA